MRYRIYWTNAAGARLKYLFLTEDNHLLYLPLKDKATRFTREEVNTVLLVLENHGGWKLPGAKETTWPAVEEVR